MRQEHGRLRADDVLPGEFAKVEIVDACEHDLTARVVA